MNAEEQLELTLQKLKLDKEILFKEKQQVFWQNKESARDQKLSRLHSEIDLNKKKRYEQIERQKDAYIKMMLFIKQRGSNPLAEEKQILDGIKLILDNNWMVTTPEILVFFEVIGLKLKAPNLMQNMEFQQFIESLIKNFEFEEDQIMEFFKAHS